MVKKKDVDDSENMYFIHTNLFLMGVRLYSCKARILLP
jgi:hypothetical protein